MFFVYDFSLFYVLSLFLFFLLEISFFRSIYNFLCPCALFLIKLSTYKLLSKLPRHSYLFAALRNFLVFCIFYFYFFAYLMCTKNICWYSVWYLLYSPTSVFVPPMYILSHIFALHFCVYICFWYQHCNGVMCVCVSIGGERRRHQMCAHITLFGYV